MRMCLDISNGKEMELVFWNFGFNKYLAMI
jgi:hypothetical protein